MSPNLPESNYSAMGTVEMLKILRMAKSALSEKGGA